ncbi:hypothetical protein J7399_08395 [Shimia sp. R9_1]|uniref:hypothetical protein n=1 Tax=Shimia sp. R9_1 TaxID=2821111 RepID=UPI001ADB122F|nr:hypothetical protein [Shimia sp. R9_1]MBO9407442.1 hypothetical protein [Shimia sp. R9_1]
MPDIGIKIYKIRLFDGNHRGVKFTTKGDGSLVQAHLKHCLGRNVLYRNSLKKRTYRSELLPDGSDFFHGNIQYGIYGIASNIARGAITDADEISEGENELEVVERDVDDLEEIPIYFQCYFPPNSKNGYIAFQTYQTRSCAGLVLGHLVGEFNRAYELQELKMTASKVMLSGEHDPVVRDAPVKELTLIRNKMKADPFDAYIADHVEEIKLKMTIAAAGRGRSLGRYIGYFNSYQSQKDDILIYDGIEFEKAVALVDLGRNKRRKVNLIGYDSSAGSVEISDLIEYDEREFPIIETMTPVFRESIGDIALRLENP